MKKNFKLLLLLLVPIIVMVAFNAVLFIVVTSEILHSANFWIIYGVVMLAFVLLILLGIFEKKNKYNLNTNVSLVFPMLVIIIITGIIFFFFVSKLSLTAILITFIILYAFAIIGFVFSLYHQVELTTHQEKEYVTSDLNTFRGELTELLNNSAVSKEVKSIVEMLDNKELTEDETKRYAEIVIIVKKNLKENNVNNALFNLERLKKLIQG